MIGRLGLAWAAGLLSTVSPCVLPLLPIVLGTAASRHRLGPVALAGGLALSFLAIGLFVATIGFAVGLDDGVFRMAAAFLLLAIGILLLAPPLQARAARAAGPVGDWAERRFGTASGSGLWSQFGVGVLLGAVWSPCVGPTLGAASVLAAQGRDLGEVAATMLVFAIGAALPLLGLGLLSREAVLRWRFRLMGAGGGLKVLLGLALVALSGMILLGYDKTFETVLVEASPEWLTQLTTRF